MVPDIYDKLYLPEGNSSIPKKQAEFIYSFLKDKNIKKTLEVGFCFGCSTAYIMSATLSPHYVIDPNQAGQWKNSGIKNIKALKLDKYLRFENDFSHNALPKLLKKGIKIDFAFIDGMHLFDYIMVDFFYIDLLLNNNGYVLFHDKWMRSTQMVAEWIKTNKTNYRLVEVPVKNLILFQKLNEDTRYWNYFEEFYRMPIRQSLKFLLKKIPPFYRLFKFLKELNKKK